MGKVHGWRISKNVQQLLHKSSVKWSLNATKYLFCCVRHLGAIGWGYCCWADGANGLRYWQCGVVIGYIGWGRGWGAGGLLRGPGRADGAGLMGLPFDGQPPGVAEKEAGRAGEGRLIYHARSLAPLKIGGRLNYGVTGLTLRVDGDESGGMGREADSA